MERGEIIILSSHSIGFVAETMRIGYKLEVGMPKNKAPLHSVP